MAKAIRSFPKNIQHVVVARRLASETKGLGYWAAKDALKPRNPVKKQEGAK
jgi:hypothetical protein